jgi:threonine synthase
MQFQSTRNANERTGLGAAIARGLAPDGGLYVPEALPLIDRAAFVGASDIIAVARVLLAPFAAGDVMEELLPDILGDAFDFPVPTVDVKPAPAPVGARLYGPRRPSGWRALPAATLRLRFRSRPLTMVAASGDMSGAVWPPSITAVGQRHHVIRGLVQHGGKAARLLGPRARR